MHNIIKRHGVIAGLLAALLGGGSSALAAGEHRLAGAIEVIVKAGDNNQPAPIISGQHRYSTDEAYQIQQAVVKSRLQGQSAAGFKAGLTSTAAQKKFAVTAAVAGVLPPGSLVTLDGGTRVQRQQFIVPMMEAELGFRMKQAVSEPVASITQLKALVSQVLPVVELPDLGFSDRKAVTGIDIVANNVLARQCLVSARVTEPNSLDINSLQITVMRDGELILTGESSDAMGDQWQALLWLVNHTVAQGYTIETGQILITGAIGRMLPLQPGSYDVDFGVLGNIYFEAR